MDQKTMQMNVWPDKNSNQILRSCYISDTKLNYSEIDILIWKQLFCFNERLKIFINDLLMINTLHMQSGICQAFCYESKKASKISMR